MTKPVDKDSLPLDKPRRTPGHPTKSHIVKTKVDGREKIIRFGEQGAETAGKPKAGESDRMKQKRASFKARHAKNIAKGKSSPAYWANKVKWNEGGAVKMAAGGAMRMPKAEGAALQLIEQMRRSGGQSEEFDPVLISTRERQRPRAQAAPQRQAPRPPQPREEPLPLPPVPPSMRPVEDAAPVEVAPGVPAIAANVPAAGGPRNPRMMFDRGNPHVATAIEMAEKYGLPTNVFLSLIQQESGFNPTSRSGRGAIGLGQLMPGTARELGVNPLDPVQNLEGSARYLRRMLDQFGEMPLALAAYNAGPGRVRRAGNTIPNIRETQRYVPSILRRAEESGYARGGLAELDEKYANAASVASKGRNGDTLVAHINPEEAALLKARGGAGTINPRTGFLEFYGSDGEGGDGNTSGDTTSTDESISTDEGKSGSENSSISDFGGMSHGIGVTDKSEVSETTEQAPEEAPEVSMFSTAFPGLSAMSKVAQAVMRGEEIPGLTEQEGFGLVNSMVGGLPGMVGAGLTGLATAAFGPPTGAAGENLNADTGDNYLYPYQMPMNPAGLIDLDQKYAEGGRVRRTLRDELRDIEAEVRGERPASVGVTVARGIGEGGGGLAGTVSRVARAYHGSPHRFDEFDISKIGTGEGAQAYGRGLYFAENEDVARAYRDKLSNPDSRFQHALRMIQADIPDERALAILTKSYPSLNLDDASNLLREARIPRGHMYEVDLHAAPREFLNWDEPLSRQSREVQESLQRFGLRADSDAARAYDDALLDALYNNPNRALPPQPRDPTGQEIYQRLLRMDPEEARIALMQAGIPGTRYLDAGSRGVGGTHNYAVFDPEIIEITRRYAEGGLAELDQKYAEGGIVSAEPVKYDPDAVDALVKQIEAEYV